MQPHTKSYLKDRGLTGHEGYIPCEVCDRPGVDVHHVNGRIGSNRTDPSGLILLCRKCHEAAHSHAISKEFLLNRIASIRHDKAQKNKAD